MWQWLGTITFGNVLTIMSFLCAALLSWNNLNWRMIIVERWKEAQYHSLQQQVDNVSLLRENNTELKTIVKLQDRRLQMIEDRIFPGLARYPGA